MLFSPIKPMLLTSGEEPFDDIEFLFEPKWDGIRLLLHKQGDRLEAYTRSGRLVTDKFPELREAAAAIGGHTAVLDCEGVCLRGSRSAFDDFAYRCRLSDAMKIRSALTTHPATFVVFDVLRSTIEHLKEPLLERKARLQLMLTVSNVIVPSAYIAEQGRALYAWTREQEMEGIVAKRASSCYKVNTVSQDWIKIKHAKRIDAIILGYRTEPRFGLVIGLHFRTVRNKPVGIVESGISEAARKEFLALAHPLHTSSDGRTQWLEPLLVCTIQYRDRSDTHQLGDTEFIGFRFDKRVEDCSWSY
ncbi:bifunctional non-homologous end joining protein LigD [Paenibacillus phyllosphaerae]|uniref:Bifunctional non-homologous end joining protein LigD n=1 Tax=Paenibacillus phyllosphaerae TaxID=274593 RepID=A0A7W5AYI1_9BACL|nr:DNA ligase [Paenibacillus phyllosphaerae]MBB3111083.1 bifunctional non-homologous end joining protein LigD [Paenibacillus phyllosphaerae]